MPASVELRCGCAFARCNEMHGIDVIKRVFPQLELPTQVWGWAKESAWQLSLSLRYPVDGDC